MLVKSDNIIGNEYSFDAKDGDTKIFTPNDLLRKF
jgi:hypothetical protein